MAEVTFKNDISMRDIIKGQKSLVTTALKIRT